MPRWKDQLDFAFGRRGIRDDTVDIHRWRSRVFDSIFVFFSVFGFFAYIPAAVLASMEGLWGVLVADTVAYAFCLVVTFCKKVSARFRSYAGIVLFYVLGLVIQILLGPRGAGEIWLFASTVMAAFLLERRGAWAAFVVNVVTVTVLFFLLHQGILLWEGVDARGWAIKGVNFVLLNMVIVIVSIIYQRGFVRLLENRTQTRNASILGLAKLAEYRDRETGSHLKRLQDFVVILAEEVAELHEYRDYVTTDYLQDLHISVILHDIGKVGVHDSILLKPGPLSDPEFDEIKTHPEIGYEVISEIERNITGRSFYTIAKEIALHHHERWDGGGYPHGLAGEDIPLSARLVALVDVYDALTSDRPYKKALPHQQAVAIIKEGRGSHFDPDIVDAFLRIEPLIAGF